MIPAFLVCPVSRGFLHKFKNVSEKKMPAAMDDVAEGYLAYNMRKRCTQR